MLTLNINGQERQLDVPEDMPILWALRDVAHLDGQPIRSCVTPVAAAVGKRITTIEQMSEDSVGQAVQSAWQELDVVQCGFCQSGQIMAATALLSQNKAPTDADIDAAMNGNICRCGTYPRIRAAIHHAAKKLA